MFRCVVYSDEPLLIAGLNSLAAETNFEICLACSTIDELLVGLEGCVPDVVLLDDAPQLTFDRIFEIRHSAPSAKLIFWAREVSIETAQHLLDAGVSGILRKDLAPKMIQLCIQKVAQGEIWMERSLIDSLLRATKVSLSRRERQLLRLVSCGLSNKQIAEELFLAESTIKVYLSRLFRKTGVQDRFELAIHGLRHCRMAPPDIARDRGRVSDAIWPSRLISPGDDGRKVVA